MEKLNVEERVYDIQVWDDKVEECDPLMFQDVVAIKVEDGMLIIAGPMDELKDDGVPIMAIFNVGQWAHYEVTTSPREKIE